LIRVVGLGSPFGDDRVGWVAAEAAGRADGNLDVRLCAHAGELLGALLSPVDRIIVVDGMRSGAAPGTWRRLSPEMLPEPGAALSSHSTDVAQALAMVRALGATHAPVTLFAVEVDKTGPLDAMTPAVAAAVPRVMDAILAEAQAVISTRLPSGSSTTLS
jgi:hydrogenase maturation protease